MFSFFFILYAVLACYCGLRLYMLFGRFLPSILRNKLVFAAIIALFALSYLAFRIIFDELTDAPSTLYYLVSLFFGIYVIMLVLLLVFDVLLLISRFIPSARAYISGHMAFIGCLYLGLTLVISALGLYNTNNPQESRYTIDVNKALPQDIRIAMVSDLHITSYTRQASMEKLVNKLNAIDADIVVLVGDIVDGDTRPYEDKNVATIFRGIKSRHGVYGVLGNHEYHGGEVEKAMELFSASGMVMLRDKVAVIDELNLSLLGRDDSRVRRITGRPRLSAAELIAQAKEGSLLLSLDHQPQLAMEAKEAGVDVQLSGHTHNGQIFPANLIVKKIYDNPWGRKTYDDIFDLIVSCGYGTWGPPMRTRSFSEIVVLDLIQQEEL